MEWNSCTGDSRRCSGLPGAAESSTFSSSPYSATRDSCRKGKTWLGSGLDVSEVDFQDSYQWQHVCSYAYARTNHQMRQVSRSLQVSEITSRSRAEIPYLRSRLRGFIHQRVELMYRKESSRCRATCLKWLIILFVIVVL